MDDLNEIMQVKRAVEQEMMGRAGVVGVDVGYKYVGGQRTEEMAIRVHVAEKREVEGDERIPEMIGGFKTDVLENRFVLYGYCTPGMEKVIAGDMTVSDPVMGGRSIGPCRRVNGCLFAGTLGAVVFDVASGVPMLLSNFHIMCVDQSWQVGDVLAQPGLPDSGDCATHTIGAVQRAALGGQVDCAVSTLAGRAYSGEIVDVGAIAGMGEAAPGMPVRKRGRSTALTYGIVESVGMTLTIDYGGEIGPLTFTDQIGIQVDTQHGIRLGEAGDSGSLFINESQQAIGLFFAGNTDGTFGAANPIAAVMEAMKISLSPIKSGQQ